MKKYALFILAIMNLIQLTACFETSVQDKILLNKTVVKTNVNEIEDRSDLTKEQKAEAIAQEAEKLMTPVSFMYAYKIAKKAESYNKNNFRSQLLLAILAPEMKMQGIMKRAESLLSSSASAKRSREKLTSMLGKSESLKNFFYASDIEDLASESQVQILLKDITSQREKLRVFISKNKDKKIVLNTPYMHSAGINVVSRLDTQTGTLEVERVSRSQSGHNDKDWYSSNNPYEFLVHESSRDNSQIIALCNTEIANDGEYEVVCHESIDYEIRRIAIMRADFEFAEQVAASLVIQMLVANTYNLEGLVSLLNDLKDTESSQIASEIERRKNSDGENGNKYQRQMMLELIKEKQNLGKDLNIKDLAYINTLGANAIPAIRMALSNQSRICPAGHFQENQRPGHMLSRGVCLSSTLAGRIISDLENALTGKDIEIKVSNSTSYPYYQRNFSVQAKATMNVQKFINGSLSNLKSLDPYMNDSGRVVFANESANGIISSNNLNEFIKILSYSDREVQDISWKNRYYYTSSARIRKNTNSKTTKHSTIKVENE